MNPEQDPLAVLRAALRAMYDAEVVPPDLADRVLASAPETPARVDTSRHRWWRRPLTLVAAGVLAAGCVAAATIALRGQPTRPEVGIACKSAPTASADVVGAPPAIDAIAACSRVWTSGQLPDPDNPSVGGTVPPLSACIGPGGLVEVFPNLEDCRILGLEPADNVLSPENQRALEFQDQVSTLNGEGCLDEVEVRTAIGALLEELELSDWTIALTPSMDGRSGCVKGQVDTSRRVVDLFIL